MSSRGVRGSQVLKDKSKKQAQDVDEEKSDKEKKGVCCC